MCGIFGFSGKEGKKANLNKLAILGLYNVQRGVDSCGYYYSGNIVKGTGDVANFSKFISKNKLIKGDLNCEVFMGHTRKSTSGGNTAENAHPHEIGNYVQTHNGVIRNAWEICKNHNVDHSKIFVDSIGLASIIAKDGFQVLNEYTGFAALTMTFKDDPHSLYLYHGASKEYKYSKDCIEERPLFVLDTPEGIYYSSLAESLEYINNDPKKKVYILPHNIVFKIRHGKFTNYKYVVNREEVNVGLKQPNTYFGGTATTLFNNLHSHNNNCATSFNNGVVNNQKPLTENSVSQVVHMSSALRESIPILESRSQDLYFKRGRYYLGGKNNVKNGRSNILLHGEYNITREGKIINDPKNSVEYSEPFFFIKGVMLKGRKEYNNFIKKHINLVTDTVTNFAYFISDYSKYPVINLENEGTGVKKDYSANWYKKSKAATETFLPKFSKRTYTIKNGLLIKISKTFDGEKSFIEPHEKMYIDVLDLPTTSENSLMLITIKGIIMAWAGKVLKKGMVKTLPEIFLIFIDYFNERTMKDGPNLSDKIIEEETAVVVKDLILTKITLQEYFEQLFEKDFICDANIATCFSGYERDELFDFENRYLNSDFDGENLSDFLEDGSIEDKTVQQSANAHPKLNFVQDPKSGLFVPENPKLIVTDVKGAKVGLDRNRIDDNVKKLKEDLNSLIIKVLDTKRIIDQEEKEKESDLILVVGEEIIDDILDLERKADILQMNDNELAQVLAFNLYKFIDESKKTVITTLEEKKYKAIVNKLTEKTCSC